MCFLIPILTGLLGALLGYLLGKSGGNKFEAEYNAELEKNRKLSADFAALQSSSSGWEGKYNTLHADYDVHKSKFASLEGDYNALKASGSANADASAKLQADLDDCNSKYNTEIEAWKSKYATLEADYNSYKTSHLASAATGAVAGAAVAGNSEPEVQKIAETSVAKDDLKVIEGIGPKIEELLHAKGIYTFAQLAEANDEDTQAILKEAGSRFQMHDTSTWNEQASLARDGKWEELKELQARLNAGRGEASAYVFDAESAKTLYGSAVKADDLKIVEGIGPKIEELFHNAGITTWKQLSELSTERCKEILDSGGERFQMHNPETWPKQCEMAYKGQFAELKKWQEELDAGKS